MLMQLDLIYVRLSNDCKTGGRKIGWRNHLYTLPKPLKIYQNDAGKNCNTEIYKKSPGEYICV